MIQLGDRVVTIHGYEGRLDDIEYGQPDWYLVTFPSGIQEWFLKSSLTFLPSRAAVLATLKEMRIYR